MWHGSHRDVHPKGSTYDEITNDTLVYGAAIKSVCSDCLVAGYSAWGWCGYFGMSLYIYIYSTKSARIIIECIL